MLVRLGFFFLGSFLYSSICGFIFFFINELGSVTHNVFIYFIALIGFATTEFMTRRMNFFGYGLDDAFLLGAHMALFIAVGDSSDFNMGAVFITMAIVSVLTYLRYMHLSSALLACIGLTGSLGYFLFEFGAIGKSILPFVMMFFAATLYFLCEKSLKNLKENYYHNGIELTKVFSLVLFYLSGNYLVVRELSILLLGNNIPATQEISFAPFFYLFTVAIPVVYIVYSLKKRDRNMLWIGLAGIAFSIFTIRYYHHILPAEAALTVGGLLLFAFAYFSIKRIEKNTSGITFMPDRFSDANALLNTELLMTAAQLGIKPEHKQEESPMKFGDGGFSGGGSGGNY